LPDVHSLVDRFIEGIIYLMMSDQAFAEKYGMAFQTLRFEPVSGKSAMFAVLGWR
jgi:hypothetical protein